MDPLITSEVSQMNQIQYFLEILEKVEEFIFKREPLSGNVSNQSCQERPYKVSQWHGATLGAFLDEDGAIFSAEVLEK